MQCIECGVENSADSRYCKECGTRLDTDHRTIILTEAERNVVKDPVEQERLTKLLDMAFWHKQVGNINSALLACEAALVIHPDSTTAHSLLGSLYEKRGQYDKAIEHVERVVQLNPKNPMEQARLAQLRDDAVRRDGAGGGLLKAMAARSGGDDLKPIDTSRVRSSSLDGPRGENRLAPALTALLVVAAVVTIGIYIVHRPPRAAGNAPLTYIGPGPGPILSGNPAGPVKTPAGIIPDLSTGAGAPSSVVALPKADAPGSKIASSAIAAQSGASDPFAVAGAPAVSGTAAAKAAAKADAGSGKVHPLPAIAAVPNSSTVPPAPVTVSTNPGTSVTPMPQHTVVVQNIPAPASVSAPATPAAAPATDVNSSPDSYIHITVDKTDSTDGTLPPGEENTIVISSAKLSPADSAGSYQQRAILLEQQGDYKDAAAAYNKAIGLYNGEIASGHDADTARNGLRVCETGLKICQESQ